MLSTLKIEQSHPPHAENRRKEFKASHSITSYRQNLRRYRGPRHRVFDQLDAQHCGHSGSKLRPPTSSSSSRGCRRAPVIGHPGVQQSVPFRPSVIDLPPLRVLRSGARRLNRSNYRRLTTATAARATTHGPTVDLRVRAVLSSGGSESGWSRISDAHSD